MILTIALVGIAVVLVLIVVSMDRDIQKMKRKIDNISRDVAALRSRSR